VNMFHVFLQGTSDRLTAARDQIAESHDIWLFGGLQSVDVPDTWKFELAVGEAALQLSDDEIVAAFTELIRLVGTAD